MPTRTSATITWLEVHYASNAACLGPPTSIYTFETLNPLINSAKYASQSYANRSFLFTDINNLTPYPINSCGNCGIDLSLYEFCCVSILDSSTLSTPNPYLSATNILLTDANTMETHDATLSFNSPLGANSHTYCQLTASVDTTASLFTYNTTLFLNDASCISISPKINMSASCSLTGILNLYSDPVCASLESTFQLSPTSETLLQSKTWGSFTAKLYSFKKAKQSVGWISFKPAGTFSLFCPETNYHTATTTASPRLSNSDF